MKYRNAFTKIDLVIILICLTFLLANIAAISEGGQKRAKAAVCLSNLMKWGQIFQAYTTDNDGFFHKRQIGTTFGYSRMWQYTYKPYYNDKMMRFCPAATNPAFVTGPFGTWNYQQMGQYSPTYNYPSLLMPGESEYDYRTGQVTEGYFTGSYGMNRCVEDMQGGAEGTNPRYWRRAGVKGGDKVPVFLDCMYLYYYPNPDAQPPAYDGDWSVGSTQSLSCIDRHSSGFINCLFLDFSARKVGLKELWTLKGSQTFDTCGPWTICAFDGDANACAAAWDEAAPWMKDFPEY